ncbi:DUF3025 domain-containing protein [Salinimonas lutimaris]|uniref:DUF3025 domain-containing protein n=1 Tax=Salinimonas lutimaris TaxID=914153 RepID=UPI0010C103FD|nr:DUF3025 domain-containing protein [Salinimonas lutimaris]
MNSANVTWQELVTDRTASPPVYQILQQLSLLQSTTFPQPAQLQQAASHWHQHRWMGPEFKGQSTFDADENRYYEQIIGEDATVPTRENSWHDLFNASIWVQFPHTKQYLNDLHMQDIREHGVHPRTARRNHLTHFDECGVVLAIPRSSVDAANELLSDLASHHWHQALLHRRSDWGQVVIPYVFGHANLEMMLQPFIGLTGKWLAVIVPDTFTESSEQQRCRLLDEAMVARIRQLDDFMGKGLLPPLPLLGVPGWFTPQDKQFYSNTEYFRPRRHNRSVTRQLPL